MSSSSRFIWLISTALTVCFFSSASAAPQADAQATRPSAHKPDRKKKSVAAGAKARNTPQVERLSVRGNRGNIGGALNEQRNSAGVSSVMSREQIEQAPQTNLSDILTRLPGVSSYSNMGQGQAATGESQYITIRGLDSSYNAYSLNGEQVTGADPATRALSFNMLSPYGITAIKVSKSTTADMDGAALGGAIDIRTPTAFDFNGPYRKITGQGQFADMASNMGAKHLGGNIEAEVAQRFGSENQFGIYVAGYYLDKDVGATAVAPNSAYHSMYQNAANGTDQTVSQLKYDAYTTNIKRYGGTLSLNYATENQTAYFLGTYGAYNTKEDDNQASIRGAQAGYNADGKYVSQAAYRGQYFETDDSAQLLTTQKLGGTTKYRNWDFSYDIFNSYATQNSPNQVEASMYPSQRAIAAGTGETTYLIADAKSPNISGPANVISQVKNESNDIFWKTQGRDAGSLSDEYGIHADAKYKFHSDILDYIQFGFRINQNKRQSYEHPFFHDDNNFVYNGPYFGGPAYPWYAAGGPSVNNIPGKTLNVFQDQLGGLRGLNRSWVKGQAVPYKYQNDPNGAGNYTQNDWNANTSRATETVYAGFTQLHLHVNKIEFLPGFRYEYTNFSGTHWISAGDDATGHFGNIHQKYDAPLPMLNINWRPTNMSVVRFSVRRSFTRPAFGLINGATSITLDSRTNQILSMSSPNPNLRPTRGTLLDLSAELYNHHEGVVSLALYYKELEKFIFTSVSGTSNSSTLGGNVPSNAYTANGTLFSMPENGGNATIKGLEINAMQRLYFLPSFLSDFGVNANLTLQESHAQSGIVGHAATSLPRAPGIMFNAGLYYAGHNFRADINYQYTGRQLLSLQSSGPDFYLQPIGRLDFTMKYHVPIGLDISFAAQNLSNAPAFYETEGKSHKYLAYDSGSNGAYVQTGRTFLFGLGYTF